MEMAESVLYDLTGENLDSNFYKLRPISSRIIINDSELVEMDPHGQNVLDLDGDGILDIMVSSGGRNGDWVRKKYETIILIYFLLQCLL